MVQAVRIFHVLLLRHFNCRRIRNGDARICWSRRDDGSGDEAVLCRFVPAVSIFTGTAKEGKIMNQLTEEVPKADVTGRLDPTVQSFLKSQARKGGPAINKLSVEEARAALVEIQGGYIAKLPVDIEERTILVGPRGN